MMVASFEHRDVCHADSVIAKSLPSAMVGIRHEHVHPSLGSRPRGRLHSLRVHYIFCWIGKMGSPVTCQLFSLDRRVT
ncbi:unnamed protein product [Angiostrongylus costaricensis]|uniref:Uncharacterized protein n=1 Tax=Angiostrongylus costaricensis TaxID=334426 RepID=A0A0R3Q2G9_ANGCS|nr:unnamed protein product [Angiostrongylus costaricensis]